MQEPEQRDFQTTVRLVRAVQTGDSAALDDLFSRYLPRVRQMVAVRTGQRLRRLAELDDLVQDALLRALKSVGTFEHRSEGTFGNWLAKCVEREVIDQARKATSKKRGEGRVLRFADCDSDILRSSILSDGQATPSQEAHAGEMAAKIEETLLAMPEHQRELVVLRVICGMSYAELADELGLPGEGAARVAVSRALGKLKERVRLS